jgi:hypothetical protein
MHAMQHTYSLVLIFFIVTILLQIFFPITTTTIHQAYSSSPSFVRQEIIDASNDWFFWKGSNKSQDVYSHDGILVDVEKAKDMSGCKTGKEFISPDIRSVSYISDGKTLNASVWLTSNFEEPPVNDTLDTFQEELRIEIAKTNLTLEKYMDLDIAKIPDPLVSANIIKNSTILAGNPAYKAEYNTTQGQHELKVMEIWTMHGDKSYDFTYYASPDRYLDQLLTVQKMLDSVEIGKESYKNNSSFKKNQSNDLNLSPYVTPEFSILHPIDWIIPEDEIAPADKAQSGKPKIVIFRSPFEDELLNGEPSWNEIVFTMAIDIDSVHEAGTDYRVIYSRIPYNVWTGNWTRQVQEISAYDDARILEEANNYTIFDSRNRETKYILFSFDLDKINSPQKYKAVFYLTNYFVKDRSFCRLIDTTNWVIIPPPEFSLSTSAGSVVLRPGEEKDIELRIEGNTDLQSEASLTATNNSDVNDVEVDFIPNKISIPASGTGTSTLHLTALNSAKSKPYTFPIIANISFPTSITNRGGETFSNNRSVSIMESSNMTLTILPPYSWGELLRDFSDTWITPAAGIWTFFAAVGAVIAPIMIKLYRKKREKIRNENKSK